MSEKKKPQTQTTAHVPDVGATGATPSRSLKPAQLYVLCMQMIRCSPPSAIRINRCKRALCQAASVNSWWAGGGGAHISASKHTSHPLAGALKRRRQPLLLWRASFIICCCSAVCAPYCLLCWGTAGFVQTDERKILLFTRLCAVNNLSKASAKHKKRGWEGGGTLCSQFKKQSRVLCQQKNQHRRLSRNRSWQKYKAIFLPALEIIRLQKVSLTHKNNLCTPWGSISSDVMRQFLPHLVSDPPPPPPTS